MNLAIKSPSYVAKLLTHILQYRWREMKTFKNKLADYCTHKSKLDKSVIFFSFISLLREELIYEQVKVLILALDFFTQCSWLISLLETFESSSQL